MARPPRIDAPGTLHHVFNRALSRRTLVETARDAREFMAGLARLAREDKATILAFSVLTTHYHLFVESPEGEISSFIRDLQSRYALYFNRVHRRKGPLFESRFLSKVVTTQEHAQILLRYIDANAVEAGLVAHPVDHSPSSAWFYARPSRPKWLNALRLAEVLGYEWGECFSPEEYAATMATEVGVLERWVVERGYTTGSRLGKHPVDDLFEKARPHERRRFFAQCLIADGTTPGTALVDPATLGEILLELSRERGPLAGPSSRRPDGWQLLRVAALRRLAGCTWHEVASHLGKSHSQCHAALQAFDLWSPSRTCQEALHALSDQIEKALGRHLPWAGAGPR
ncbi:MAG: transposase [Planctomycetes bacterium]|nr:transposase [Planctomycetota bacterium]MCB9890844.1 transposase [Planctomycetota bacterium]